MAADYATYDDYQELNSELVIYRDARTKKRNYVARVLLAKGGYKIRSLKTTDASKAIVRANAFYDDLKLRERRNLPMRDPTLREVLDFWLKNDGWTLSERRRKAVQRFFNVVVARYVADVVGSDKGLDLQLNALTQTELNRFAHWRTDERTFEKPPSYSTLGLEIGNFNCVTRCARANNLTDHDYLIPTLRRSRVNVEKKAVRPSLNTFTQEQVSALSAYLRRHFLSPTSVWNRGIVMLDDDDEPVRGDDGAIRSKNRMYLSRANLYASYFILLNTGIRLQELYGLRWRDIERHFVDVDSKERERYVHILRVAETKFFRRDDKPAQRIVVGPDRLSNFFELLQRENPQHCSPDDYVINVGGRRRKSQQPLFEKVQAAPQTWNGKAIDCSRHRSGTTLDLRHLRSFYVSKMLIEVGIPPHILKRQTGHSLDTIMRFYLTSEPMKRQKLMFGGWAIDSQLVRETMMLS